MSVIEKRACLRCRKEYFDDGNTLCPTCDADVTSIDGRTGLRDWPLYDRLLAFRKKGQEDLAARAAATTPASAD